ncbi:MAG: hypothetical protein HRT94_07655 [Alphaproteobacteria bacterium]|nr:hypothetical protein [Alphaproteobacteria bacterium]
MSRTTLAEDLSIKTSTINANLNGRSAIPSGRLELIQKYLERQGIVFSMDGDDGVKRATGLNQITLEGQEGVREFFNDVYETTKATNREILIFNGLPSELINSAGEEWYKSHAARMQKLNVVSKNILKEGELNLIGKKFASYKWIPKEMFRDKMIYVYGNKFAFMSFDPDALIKITEEADIADSLRLLIDLAWENVARDV